MLLPLGSAGALVTTAPMSTDGPTHGVGPTGRVYASVVIGNVAYFGGDFSNVGGVTRNNLAAVNLATGDVTNWNPNANNLVLSMAVSPDNSVIYVGGAFTTVGGVTRRRVAAINPQNGNVTNWNPNPDGRVRGIDATSTTVYLGGAFSSAGGANRNNLAAVNTTNGNAIAAWAADADERINAVELAPNDATLYVGGDFDRVDGATRHHAAAVNASTGAVINWTTNTPHIVLDLTVSPNGNSVYVAVGGPYRTGGNLAAAYSTATGNTQWQHQADGDFQAVAAAGDAVYFGGHFFRSEGPIVNKLVAYNPANGNRFNWTPGANSGLGIWSLTYSSGYLLVGGDFTEIGGVEQRHFAVFVEPGGPTTTTTTTTVPPGGGGNGATIGLRGLDGITANAASFTVTVPGNVEAGDGLLLFVSANSADAQPSTPPGWTLFITQVDNSMVTHVYRRVAAAGDAGDAVVVGLDQRRKANVLLVASWGTRTPNPVGSRGVATQAANSASHTTPTINANSGAIVLSYWADKSAATTNWNPPGGVTQRYEQVGIGGGRIGVLLADSGGPVAAAPYGGLTATTDSATARAVMLTIALVPG
jgi:WD40 repeat protein